MQSSPLCPLIAGVDVCPFLVTAIGKIGWQAANASDSLLGMVNELANFLQEYEGELRTLADISLKEMNLGQRKVLQRWFDAVVTHVDLEREGDELSIQTDAFGVLPIVSTESTMIRCR